MWEIGLLHQLIGSGYAVLTGIFFSLVYDILKAYCILKKCKTFAVFIKDIGFSLFITFITFMLLMARSNGAVRGYILLFIAVGFVLFRLTLSRFWLKFLTVAFSKLFQLSAFLRSVMSRFCDLLDRFDAAVLNFFKKIIKKALKLIKNS